MMGVVLLFDIPGHHFVSVFSGIIADMVEVVIAACGRGAVMRAWG